MSVPRKPELQIASRPVSKAERNPRLFGWMQRYRAKATLKVPAGGTYSATASGATRRAAEYSARQAVEALAATREARRVKAL